MPIDKSWYCLCTDAVYSTNAHFYNETSEWKLYILQLPQLWLIAKMYNSIEMALIQATHIQILFCYMFPLSKWPDFTWQILHQQACQWPPLPVCPPNYILCKLIGTLSDHHYIPIYEIMCVKLKGMHGSSPIFKVHFLLSFILQRTIIPNIGLGHEKHGLLLQSVLRVLRKTAVYLPTLINSLVVITHFIWDSILCSYLKTPSCLPPHSYLADPNCLLPSLKKSILGKQEI